jgi:EAL domain-containing protein (putative c-di-GMP-specific phosphodiesterase class I)
MRELSEMNSVRQASWAEAQRTIVVCASSDALGSGLHSVNSTDCVLHCTTVAALLRCVRERSVDLVVLDGPTFSDAQTVAAVRLAVSAASLLVLKPEHGPLLARDPSLNVWTVGTPATSEAFALIVRSLLGEDDDEPNEEQGSVSRTTQSRIAWTTQAHSRMSLALDGMWMAFQPIVSLRERRVCAYEALLRTRSEEFSSPLALLHEASRLDRIWDVSRTARERTANECGVIPDDALVLVNLHATDLFDDALLDGRNPLLPFASRVVFEVTEQASVRCADEIGERVRALRALGFRLAVDDLGAGYSALSVLAELEPEIVKVDMSIIRDVDRSLTKQRVIRSVLHLALDLGSTVICEGVETVRERDALAALGCDWLQGYLFARPSRGFASVPDETYGEGP